MNIVGVDPGVGGGLALFHGARLMAVADMPTVSVRVGKTQRNRVDVAGLARILRDWEVGHAAVERVAPRNGIVTKDGKVIKRGDTPMTAGYLMESYGIVHGVLVALGIPVTVCETQAWRKAGGVKTQPGMSHPDRKEASRQRALQLFPMQAAYFARKKDSDRAESALVGWWLVQKERLG